MSSSSDLFNAYSQNTGSRYSLNTIDQAEAAFRSEFPKATPVQLAVSEIASSCSITEKVRNDGLNFFVARQEGETNSDWSTRTEDLSQALASVTGTQASITTSKGRIVAKMANDTGAYQRFAKFAQS